MGVVLRTGPLVLVLGFVLMGCDQAGNGPPRDSGVGPAKASETDYVLTVEGMH
jgi:hypothetical protein